MRRLGTWSSHLPLLAVALISVVSAVSADDSSKAAANAPVGKEKLDFYRRRLHEYRLVVDGRGDKPCELVEDPLTRWDNPISQNGDGLMFLWTDRGRPVVVMNCHYNVPTQFWGRAFVSLTDRPIEMRHGDQPFWKPRQPGSALKPLDDVKPQSDKASARLVQMRNIAEEFQVICNWGGNRMRCSRWNTSSKTLPSKTRRLLQKRRSNHDR